MFSSKRNKHELLFDKGDPRQLFDLIELLGEGTMGNFWVGVKKLTKIKCVVKIVEIDGDLLEIEQEIRIMKYSESPYIVKFIGAYKREKDKIWKI